jgi:hypothetical protein
MHAPKNVLCRAAQSTRGRGKKVKILGIVNAANTAWRKMADLSLKD